MSIEISSAYSCLHEGGDGRWCKIPHICDVGNLMRFMNVGMVKSVNSFAALIKRVRCLY